MNKQLIKKYFEEFKHWLNGGKLLQKQINLAISAEWEEFEEDWDWPIDELVVVINDEFCEFRKALAEGKTVQYNFGNYGINRKDFPNTWKDLDPSIGILADRACPENYRIRPEEPKFKVGDWAINKTSKQRIIKKVTSVYSDSVTVGDSTVGINVMLIEDLELWQPQPDEYFWYHNDLVKIHKTQTNAGLLLLSARGCTYYPAERNFEDFCEPFLGQLPTSLAK